MDFKQETNAFETKLEDLKFQLKSCETTIYDFREEYRTEIALLKKENFCLISEREKLVATESERVKKLVEEKSQLSSTNFNLKEEIITYQLKVAHLKNILIEYEKSFNNQLEDLELLNKKYLNENKFLKENNQVLESKLSTLPDKLNILQEEKDKALTFATNYVARLKDFEENLKQEKMENKRQLDFKDEQYEHLKLAQTKEINGLNLKLKDAELKRQDLVKQNEISVKELQDNLARLKLEFDQLNGTNSNDKAELIILKQILKQHEDFKTNQQKNDSKNQDKLYSLECEIIILNDEISCLKRSNSKLNDSNNQLNDRLSELINENEILNIKLTNEDISITKMIKENKQKEADLENLRALNQNLNNRISKLNEDIEQLISRNKFLKEKESFTHEHLIKEKSNLKYCRSVIKTLETKKSELYKKLRSKKSQLEISRSLFNKLNDEFNILMNKYEEKQEENKLTKEQNKLIIQRLQEENKLIKLCS